MDGIGCRFGKIRLALALLMVGLWAPQAVLAAPLELSTGAVVDLNSQQLERLKAEPGVYFFDDLPQSLKADHLQQWVYIPIPASLGGGFLVAYQSNLDRALAAVGATAVEPPADDPPTAENKDPDPMAVTSGPWMWSLRAGYRHDELDWNIAGNGVNVLSELTWEDLQSVAVGGTLQRRFGPGFRILGSVDYGFVFDGDNQDSDYAGDNRTLEFSRSNNSADDGDLWDLSLGLGYDLALLTNRLTVSPLLGYSLHVQNLTITEGVQTVSEFGFPVPLGPFPGLDSSYDTQWYGPWLGLEAVYKSYGTGDPAGGFEFSLGVQYHWADYEADATWNLRGDLRQPDSFEHDADGNGVVGSGAFAYLFNARWSLTVDAKYQDWETDPGIDRIFLADGTVLTTRLNEVNWESYALTVGIRCRF
ncbi:MAG TPA: hypothetical protein ACFCUC_17275 [Desulfobacterales bacterium]